jgi:hypothetical protein
MKRGRKKLTRGKNEWREEEKNEQEGKIKEKKLKKEGKMNGERKKKMNKRRK